MGNYANSSLEERIARRKKRQRAARRRRIIFGIIALLLVVALGYGLFSLFSGDDTPDEPIEVIEQSEGEIEETTPPVQEEEPIAPESTDEPATEPETEPETQPETQAPEAEVVPEAEPEVIAVRADMPLSYGPALSVNLVSKQFALVAAPTFINMYNQANSVLLKPEVDPEKPMVALTFDDGPSGKYGGIILDALEKNGARASFFVLGELVDGNSANLKRAVDIGCEVGNHTYDHTTLTKLSAADIKSQISKTSELIEKATGEKVKLVRTPGGAVNATVKSSVGAPIINWSLDTVDWKSRNTDAIVKIVLDNVQDGDIILMHEIYKTSAEAAEKIIPELKKRGYQLVTVTEMMEAREIDMQAGKVYFNAYPKKKKE